MSGTTDKTDMKWSYEIHEDWGSPLTTPEPGSLDDMSILQAKLFDHTAQVAKLEEIYRNNTDTYPLVSSSLRDDDFISFEANARLGEPFTIGAVPHETPNYLAGQLKSIHSRQDGGGMAAVSLPIARDHGTPLPDGQGECARWSQLIEGYEEPFLEDETMGSRLTHGNSALRAFQSERNLHDHSPPQPPSVGLTINDAALPKLVLSPRSPTSKPTSPSRKLARNRLHMCQYPGCTRFYDRASRAQACLNKHQDEKPHRCEGGCENTECDMSFISTEQLGLHEKAPCPRCMKAISKRNMAKHLGGVHRPFQGHLGGQGASRGMAGPDSHPECSSPSLPGRRKGKLDGE